MEDGWIHLHRKIVNWEWYSDHNTARLFIHLVLTANHKDKKWRGIEIKRGEHITSYQKLAEETTLSVRNVRTSLNKLKMTGEVTIKTSNKYTMVAINKYDDYDTSDKQNDKRMTSNRQASDKQVTTNKNEKNEKNEKNIDPILAETSSVIIEESQSKEIAQVMEIFVQLNPTLSYGNKSQRSAIISLLDKLGFERTLAVAQYAMSIMSDQYAPRITTPIELKNKLGQLVAYKQKNVNQPKGIIL